MDLRKKKKDSLKADIIPHWGRCPQRHFEFGLRLSRPAPVAWLKPRAIRKPADHAQMLRSAPRVRHVAGVQLTLNPNIN